MVQQVQFSETCTHVGRLFLGSAGWRVRHAEIRGTPMFKFVRFRRIGDGVRMQEPWPVHCGMTASRCALIDFARFADRDRFATLR